jgi:DNA polymerase III delta prime subunit
MIPGFGGMGMMMLFMGFQTIAGALSTMVKPVIAWFFDAFTIPVNIVCPKITKAVTYYINNRKNSLEANTDKYRDTGTVIRQNVTQYSTGMCTYKMLPFYVKNPKEDDDKKDTKDKEGPLMTLHFWKWGYDQNRIKQFLEDARLAYELYQRTVIKNKIDFYEWSTESYSWRFIDHLPARSEETISGAVHKKVIDDLRKFIREKENYIDLHIPRKRCILLGGPPGTGKTTLAYGCASVLEKPIFKLSLRDPKLNNAALRDLARVIMPGAVLIIDDFRFDTIETFDMKGKQGGETQRMVADDKGALRVEAANKIDITCLLDLFDGGPASDRVTFIISNHVEEMKARLGAALFRDGRIDAIYEIGYCVDADIRQYFETTMRILVKVDTSSQPPSSDNNWRAVPAHDWKRIAGQCIADDQSLPLLDRMLCSPMTPNTILYDMVIYLRSKSAGESRALCTAIRENTGFDPSPLIAISMSQMYNRLQDMSKQLDMKKLMETLSEQFLERVKAVTDRPTMAKLQTVLITSKYNPFLMLDNCQNMNAREIELDPLGELKAEAVAAGATLDDSKEPDIIAAHLALAKIAAAKAMAACAASVPKERVL